MHSTPYKMAVVQAYINHMTGKTVKINPPRNINDIRLLDIAFLKAFNTLDSIQII